MVCDCGSSKAQWMRNDEDTVRALATAGFNPYQFASVQELTGFLHMQVKDWTDFSGNLFFYGAGCAAAEKRSLVASALQKIFPQARVAVFDDLLGAARAAAGKQPAIVLVLGTGMNNGFYDGTSVRFHVDSLGYILGDEGSGVDLGRRLLQAALRQQMPADLAQAFATYLPLSRDQILDQVYGSRSARVFLADQVRFIARHKNHTWIQQLIREAFYALAQRVLSVYEVYRSLPVHVVGSVGSVFEEELRLVIAAVGFQPGRFLAQPVEDLFAYHASERISSK